MLPHFLLARGFRLSLACLFVTLAPAAMVAAQVPVPAPGISGEWRTFGDDGTRPRGVVRITEREGVFTGVIARSLVPGEDPEKRCTRCTDARKDRVLRGMAIVTGMKFQGTEAGVTAYAGGEILDPDTGGIYRSTMTLSADGKRLTVRGYIGIPLFGRTQEWQRIE